MAGDDDKADTPAQGDPPGTPGAAGGPDRSARDEGGAAGPSPADDAARPPSMPSTPLQTYRRRLMQQSGGPAAAGAALAAAGAEPAQASFPALTSQIVQAVEFTNDETASAAPTLIATPADAMITQAAGLAAQSSAHYYDGMTKLVMASQSVMLQKLTEDLSQEKLPQAAEQAVGIAVTELLLAGAMAVAAAGGAMEAESASFSIDKINQAVKTLMATTTSGQ